MRKMTQFGIFGAALALLAVVLLVGTAVRPVSAQDTGSISRTISVNGSGEAFGTPDIASISMGVDVSDADISVALNNANSTLARIVEALKAAGVDEKDIQTAYFNVYPEDQYDPNTGAATGQRVFHVSTAANVTLRDIQQVAAVIQSGLSAGANSVGSLSFGIADMKKLEEQARLNAVADARARAEQLAAAFGVSVGEVITVSESYSSGSGQPLFRADAVMASGAAPQINAGELSVSVQVSVTFAIGG
jgi:uncharacterized protein YggE